MLVLSVVFWLALYLILVAIRRLVTPWMRERKGPAAALGQDLEVTARLRGLHDQFAVATAGQKDERHLARRRMPAHRAQRALTRWYNQQPS